MPEIHSDDHHKEHTRNLARFFVENRTIAWVLLVVTISCGAFSYTAMEKRKDPIYSNLYAVAVCTWPGASADKVEQLITRKIEEKMADNMKVIEIKSTSRSNVSVVTVKIDDRVKDTDKEFDDLNARVNSINDLPSGAGPIRFMKDYGDVSTLMLTVASPPADDVDLSLRADEIAKAVARIRSQPGRVRAPPGARRTAVVVCFPRSVESAMPHRGRDLLLQDGSAHGVLSDAVAFGGSGYIAVDAVTSQTDDELLQYIQAFVRQRLKPSQLHPDLWLPAIIHEPQDTKAALAAVCGDKYSYREMDDFTDLIQRTLQTLPQVAKITRHGNLGEQINLDFSQERLASYGLQPVDLRDRLSATNILPTGGILEIVGKNLPIRPTGAFKNTRDIANVIVATSDAGTPIYLRDVVEIGRDYEAPPRYLEFLTWKDNKGRWHRTRAIALAVFMRTEEHIDKFADAVNDKLASLTERLPADLVMVRTSDQPKQVEDNLELFMSSLIEAIVLVVLAALIGFWEWRSALVIAMSIPTTLAMTFGMMHMLGLDIQQCSVAALIISLGLLVDDPVVAGDAIKRELTAGHDRLTAAWLGPTKLAHAILFATITNIAAYLPFLMMSGEIGQFIFSLPIVITCSLIASRIVSMTFIPLLGYYILLPEKKKEGEGRESRSPVVEKYLTCGRWVLANRLIVLAASIVILFAGFWAMSGMKTSFFPNDIFNLCWVDVWLPEDAPLVATNDAAAKVEDIVRNVTSEYEKAKADKTGKHEPVLEAVTTFLGGSGPRFWSTIIQELDQLNYAQVIMQVYDKHDTDKIIPLLQTALSKAVPEARCDVRVLEGGKPIGVPVCMRICGEDEKVLRKLALEMAHILVASPLTARTRQDWGAGSFAVKVNIDGDRAYLSGFSNADVSTSSVIAQNGYKVDTMLDGNQQIPIVIRMRAEEGSQVQSLADMYVYSPAVPQKVPLSEMATITYGIETEKICRRNQFRTISVGAFTVPGVLPSEVMDNIRPQITAFQKRLPPGYVMEIGGEEAEQSKSFDEMTVVMITSIVSIFLCLLFQFKSVVKPMLVFAGIPYGILGAFIGLAIMGQPFGFPAFMGIASLSGVIVSHIIVLFDFIETSREEGASLEDALLHAILVRLRPVLITVSATVLGFIPLAMHGGPLWEPLCYAQIGGLVSATVITLVIVPTIYAISVLDLKVVRWGPDASP